MCVTPLQIIAVKWPLVHLAEVQPGKAPQQATSEYQAWQTASAEA
jgi:hypothetical protein